MTEDIILRATAETGDLEESFEGAEESVRRAVEGAQDALEGLDASAVDEVGEALGDRLSEGADQAADAADGLSDRLDSLTTAARDTADATTEAAEASTDLEQGATDAADAVETLSDATDQLADRQRDAAKASNEATDEARDTAEALERVSAATRNAANSGSEAGTRIVQAMSAISRSTGEVRDGVHAAELAFEALGGSPVEFIQAANNDFERGTILLADLQKNIRKMGEEAFEGLGGFADSAAKVTQRMAVLEDLLERQGDQALPEIRSELDRLRGEYRKTFDEGARRAANLEAAIETNEDALKRMKLEARGSAGELVNLTEAMRLRFPQAAKAIGSAVSALATFKVAFEGTRDFVEFLDREFGLSVDRFIRRLGFLDKIAEGIVGTGESAERSLELVTNSINSLGLSGKNVSDLQQRLDALRASIRAATDEAPVYTGRHRELTDQLRIEGENAEALEALVKDVTAAWFDFSEQQKQVGTDASAAAQALRELEERALGVEVEKLVGQYTNLSDAFRDLVKRADELRGTPVLDTFRDEVSEVRANLAALPDELVEVFERTAKVSRDDAVAAIDAMGDALGIVVDRSEEVEEAATAAAQATGEAWEAAGAKALDVWGQVERAILDANGASEPTGPDGSALLADLDDAQERLADLERQRADLLTTPSNDIDADFELFRELALARREVQQLESEARAIPLGFDAGPAVEAATNAGNDISRALSEALGSSGFVEAFRELAPAVQQEVASLVSQLEGLATSGERLDPAVVRYYGDAIRQALGGDAVGAVSGLDGAFGGLQASSRSAVDQLLDIARASREAGDGTAAAQQSVEALAGSAGEGVITLSRTGETLAMIGEKAGASADQVGRLRGEAEATQQAAGDLDGSAADAAGGVEGLGEAVRTAGESAEGARLKIEGTGESVRILREGAWYLQTLSNLD